MQNQEPIAVIAEAIQLMTDIMERMSLILEQIYLEVRHEDSNS